MSPEIDSRSVKQDPNQHMGQLIFSNVPAKGWITDLDVHGLLYGPIAVVGLPAQCGEILNTDVMPRCYPQK